MESHDMFIQVSVTFGKREDALDAALAVVEAHLAACAQVIGPIQSCYHWQGAIEKTEEFLLLIKTGRSRYERLEQAILALHPYETPEILAVPIVAGSPGYLGWMEQELHHEPGT